MSTNIRMGIGYDIHRLLPTIKTSVIPIGGVEIPCYYRVQAHSDGDVLLHAITDACLGALALGDIGQWFPDTSTSNAGRKSTEFIEPVLAKLKNLGFSVAQIDSNVLLEEPKLAAHIDAIRKSIALTFNIELACVSVKAKTMEGLGPVGEQCALSAQAIVVLKDIR